MKFGSWTGDPESSKPQCVLCADTLSNASMKPTHLKRHMETKHRSDSGKPVEFFRRRRDELNRGRLVLRSHAGSEAVTKATVASFEVSLLIARCGRYHHISETLVKPAINDVTAIMLGEKSKSVVSKVSLSHSTVRRRINPMAVDVEKQLIARLERSQYFAIQLDESTDIAGEAQLLTCVRYEHEEHAHEDPFSVKLWQRQQRDWTCSSF